MLSTDDISHEVMDVVRRTVASRLALLLEDGGILITLETDSNIFAYDTEAAEKNVDTARRTAALPAVRYGVLIYDGHITTAKNGRTAALMVEAYERGKPSGLRFIQRYQPGTEDAPLVPIGRITYVGRLD